MGSNAVGTMKVVTTREKAEQVLKGLPEEQGPVALEAVERDARVLRMLRERARVRSTPRSLRS